VAILPAIEEDRDRVTKDDEGGSGVAAPAGWQDWQHWVDGVDWSDRRFPGQGLRRQHLRRPGAA
jgi:hypothetical protein